jgi:DNA-binding transcriptional regulator LsrR (DeoR family)
MSRDDRLQRLELAARLYYEQDLNQAAVAERLGVSRPFVSRLLREAREAGIVDIKIRSLAPAYLALVERAEAEFSLAGGRLVPATEDAAQTGEALADAALSLVDELGGGRLGLGWGHVVGATVETLERRAAADTRITDVCPLVGNGGVPIRNYHSNENTRVFAQQCRARPHFLHTPALVETADELALLKQTANYRAVLAQWEQLDVALVNIGNYPSTPDFASGARYGRLLAQQRAVGRLIAYFFDRTGQVIHSDQDYAIQIPLNLLDRCPRVIGMCAANVRPDAVAGALRTGLVTHLVATQPTLEAALRHAA